MRCPGARREIRAPPREGGKPTRIQRTTLKSGETVKPRNPVNGTINQRSNETAASHSTTPLLGGAAPARYARTEGRACARTTNRCRCYALTRQELRYQQALCQRQRCLLLRRVMAQRRVAMLPYHASAVQQPETKTTVQRGSGGIRRGNQNRAFSKQNPKPR